MVRINVFSKYIEVPSLGNYHFKWCIDCLFDEPRTVSQEARHTRVLVYACMVDPFYLHAWMGGYVCMCTCVMAVYEVSLS